LLFDLDYAYLIFVRCEKAAIIKISDVAGQKVKTERLKELWIPICNYLYQKFI
jgi:hypothetical protein